MCDLWNRFEIFWIKNVVFFGLFIYNYFLKFCFFLKENIKISVKNSHYHVKMLNIKNGKRDFLLKKIKFFMLRIPMK